MGKNKIQKNIISDDFIEDIIGKVFKILPLYEDFLEDATTTKNIETINSYIDKIVTLLMGSENLYKIDVFGEVAATLEGLQCRRNLSQKMVKSTVFHCIGVLSKLKKSEV